MSPITNLQRNLRSVAYLYKINDDARILSLQRVLFELVWGVSMPDERWRALVKQQTGVDL